MLGKLLNELGPAWYYTAPGQAWDTTLKNTEVKLELLVDPDMFLMFEEGIPGCVSIISTRYGKANNPKMGEKYDPDSQMKYIVYGWVMCKSLPTHGFERMIVHRLDEPSMLYSRS